MEVSRFLSTKNTHTSTPSTPTARRPLTEHMDVSLGDGVEAAAGQQDHMGFGGFRHGVSLSSSGLLASRSSPVPVPCGSVFTGCL